MRLARVLWILEHFLTKYSYGFSLKQRVSPQTVLPSSLVGTSQPFFTNQVLVASSETEAFHPVGKLVKKKGEQLNIASGNP